MKREIEVIELYGDGSMRVKIKLAVGEPSDLLDDPVVLSLSISDNTLKGETLASGDVPTLQLARELVRRVESIARRELGA